MALPATEPILRGVSSEPKSGRRVWLASGVVAASAAAFPIHRWLDARDVPPSGRRGALRRDPAGVLDLREGFRYRILERSGGRMSDGGVVPIRPDGMACFDVPGEGWVLTRNHEVPLRFPCIGEPAYDPRAGGGVTRLVLDPQTLERRSSNLLLAGTAMNCSGGATPDGWLSCEEAVDSGHGFVFLCDPRAERAQPPVRLDALGRFRHEAAAYDPESGVIYLTEDRPDGCLYRFVPHRAARPFEGRLEALSLGPDAVDTSGWPRGRRAEVTWIALEHVTPEDDVLRHRAQAQGAASFKRGEGACVSEGALHFCATTGGPIGAGQIFRLDGDTLEVLAASTDRAEMDMPDNVTLSPDGALFFVEDGPGHDCLRAVEPDGEVVTLARNAASEGELTGVCFSPDGRALFLNMQEDGLTVAIEGDFAAFAPS